MIVLMTDADDQSSGDENVLKVAKDAQKAGVAIVTVGAGPDLDKDMVTKIAGKGVCRSNPEGT